MSASATQGGHNKPFRYYPVVQLQGVPAYQERRTET